MYVNTVFTRKHKDNRNEHNYFNAIQEDYRKWSQKYVKDCEQIVVSEVSPGHGLVHVHVITMFQNKIQGIDFLTHGTLYEAKYEHLKCFFVKQSIIPEDEVQSYYKYIHKTINYNNFKNKTYRNSKIISKGIIGRLTEQYNKRYEMELSEAGDALAYPRLQGGSIITDNILESNNITIFLNDAYENLQNEFKIK